jgi:hypothetical protein
VDGGWTGNTFSFWFHGSIFRVAKPWMVVSSVTWFLLPTYLPTYLSTYQPKTHWTLSPTYLLTIQLRLHTSVLRGYLNFIKNRWLWPVIWCFAKKNLRTMVYIYIPKTNSLTVLRTMVMNSKNRLDNLWGGSVPILKVAQQHQYFFL